MEARTIISRVEANYLRERIARGNPALPIRAPGSEELAARLIAVCFVIALRRVAPERLKQLAEEMEERPVEVAALHGVAGTGDFARSDRGGYVHFELRVLRRIDLEFAFGDRRALGMNWLYAMPIDVVRLSELIFRIERNIAAVIRNEPMEYSRADLIRSARGALEYCKWELYASAPRAARYLAKRLRVVNNDDPDAAELILPRFICEAALDRIGRESFWRLEDVCKYAVIGASAAFDVRTGVLSVAYGRNEIASVALERTPGAPFGVLESLEREVIDEGGVCAVLYRTPGCDEDEFRAALPAFDAAVERGEKGWVVLTDVVVAHIK